MARSRRRISRRNPFQRAAGLVALALPAPVQRIADTRIGSMLMLVGFPVMILFGLLNVTWVDGFPTFSLNRNKAVELGNVAREKINDLENQAAFQNWGQSTVDLLHAAQGPNHTHQASPFPSTQPPAYGQAYDWQQQQQQLYQRQVYEQQLRQQQYQTTLQQQQYQQFSPNAGQPATQGSYPSTYGYNGQAPASPSGYPAQQYYNGYALPTTSNSGQIPYTNHGGQLGRY